MESSSVDVREATVWGEGLSVDDIEDMDVVQCNGNWRTHTGNRRLYWKLNELGVLVTVRVDVVSLDSNSVRADFL